MKFIFLILFLFTFEKNYNSQKIKDRKKNLEEILASIKNLEEKHPTHINVFTELKKNLNENKNFDALDAAKLGQTILAKNILNQKSILLTEKAEKDLSASFSTPSSEREKNRDKNKDFIIISRKITGRPLH